MAEKCPVCGGNLIKNDLYLGRDKNKREPNLYCVSCGYRKSITIAKNIKIEAKSPYMEVSTIDYLPNTVGNYNYSKADYPLSLLKTVNVSDNSISFLGEEYFFSDFPLEIRKEFLVDSFGGLKEKEIEIFKISLEAIE